MKKVISVLICLLLVLTLLFPVGRVVSFYCGYRFELISTSGFAVGLAVLSILTASLDLAFPETILSKAVCVIVLLLPPLTVVNGLFLGVYCRKVWVTLCLVVYVACCLLLMIRHGKPLYLKVTSAILTAIIFAPTCLMGLMLGTFGLIIGEETVIQKVESPSGGYYAQVADRGGNTEVMVYEKSGFNALLFKVQKYPKWIYTGRYLEYETMEIYWQDDHCLIINSKPYEIK